MTTENEMPDEIYLSSQFGGTVGFEPFPSGIKYTRADIHEQRVAELLEANNRLLERARIVEAKLAGQWIEGIK